MWLLKKEHTRNNAMVVNWFYDFRGRVGKPELWQLKHLENSLIVLNSLASKYFIRGFFFYSKKTTNLIEVLCFIIADFTNPVGKYFSIMYYFIKVIHNEGFRQHNSTFVLLSYFQLRVSNILVNSIINLIYYRAIYNIIIGLMYWTLIQNSQYKNSAR